MSSLVSKVIAEEIVPKRSLAHSISILPSRTNSRPSLKKRATRRMSMAFGSLKKSHDVFPVISEDDSFEANANRESIQENADKLELPNSTARFKLSIWSQEEMRLVRKKFTEGM